MEVRLLSSVDNITNPSGNLVGVQLTNFFVLVKLEIGAIVNVFASLLAVAQCHYVFKVLQEAELSGKTEWRGELEGGVEVEVT